MSKDKTKRDTDGVKCSILIVTQTRHGYFVQTDYERCGPENHCPGIPIGGCAFSTLDEAVEFVRAHFVGQQAPETASA